MLPEELRRQEGEKEEDIAQNRKERESHNKGMLNKDTGDIAMEQSKRGLWRETWRGTQGKYFMDQADELNQWLIIRRKGLAEP